VNLPITDNIVKGYEMFNISLTLLSSFVTRITTRLSSITSAIGIIDTISEYDCMMYIRIK